MKISDLPDKFPIPFAADAGVGFIRAIPEASQIGITAGAASLTDGFPPVTFQPVGAGGTPPWGQDVNGILNQITLWSQWQNAGGTVVYDSAFSNSIGGYPKGSVLAAASIGGFWLSAVDDNTTNPDAGGAGWIGFSAVHGFQIFTSSGTFTVPAGVTTVKATVVGGGGGGANCSPTVVTPGSNLSSGGGGGAAGLAVGSYSVTPGQTVTVTVGVGGTSQTTGGTSSFGAFCSATGGGGTQFQSSSTSAGAPGGTATGGNILNSPGGFGSDGQSGAFTGMGNGAPGPWGGAGRAYAGGASATAANAHGYGAGAGGAYASAAGTNAGGTGGPGIVIVEW